MPHSTSYLAEAKLALGVGFLKGGEHHPLHVEVGEQLPYVPQAGLGDDNWPGGVFCGPSA
ncbi:hypothetical protein MASR1M66_11550 [Aminivibrio sp.]